MVCPIQFLFLLVFWDNPSADPEADFMSNGNEPSPCLSSLWIGNGQFVSDQHKKVSKVTFQRLC